MKELIEALGPWPTLQGVVIGMAVAGIGAWAILRGLQGDDRKPQQLEEAKAKWEAHNWLREIHDNSSLLVDLMQKSNELSTQLLQAINRFNDNRWNGRQ
jgi:hypothetical protein